MSRIQIGKAVLRPAGLFFSQHLSIHYNTFCGAPASLIKNSKEK